MSKGQRFTQDFRVEAARKVGGDLAVEDISTPGLGSVLTAWTYGLSGTRSDLRTAGYGVPSFTQIRNQEVGQRCYPQPRKRSWDCLPSHPARQASAKCLSSAIKVSSKA